MAVSFDPVSRLRTSDHLARSAFGNVAYGPEFESARHLAHVTRSGKAYHVRRGTTFAQHGKRGKTVSVGRGEIEKNEINIGILFQNPHRFHAIGSFQRDCLALELGKHPAQCMPNQDMVIDDENLQSRSGWRTLSAFCLAENQLELLLRSVTLDWRERDPPVSRGDRFDATPGLCFSTSMGHRRLESKHHGTYSKPPRSTGV
jgi:hypothetical protein